MIEVLDLTAPPPLQFSHIGGGGGGWWAGAAPLSGTSATEINPNPWPLANQLPGGHLVGCHVEAKAGMLHVPKVDVSMMREWLHCILNVTYMLIF